MKTVLFFEDRNIRSKPIIDIPFRLNRKDYLDLDGFSIISQLTEEERQYTKDGDSFGMIKVKSVTFEKINGVVQQTIWIPKT